MLRTLGVQTLTGVAQPVLGDVLTAAIATTDPSLNQTITVANTAFYTIGDRIVVDPLLINQDVYKIIKIVNATTMLGVLEGATGHTHAVNALIQLAIACGNVVVQAVSGNSGPVVIGTDNTVTVALTGTAIFVVEPSTAPAQPNNWQLNSNGGYNVCNTQEAWMIGAAGVKVLVYAWVF
jgi:hypothetical protein